MTQREELIGDALSDAIRRAAQALLKNDRRGAWDALDSPQIAKTLREWDRLRGIVVPSEAELQSNQAALMDDLRQALHKKEPRR